MNKVLIGLGILFLASGVWAGYANIQLITTTLYEQLNEQISQDFEIIGVHDVEVGREYFLCSSGISETKCSLYDIDRTGDLVLSVHELDESGADWRLFVNDTTKDIISTGLVDFNSVVSGQEFGLVFIPKSVTDLNAQISWDLNIISYSEI